MWGPDGYGAILLVNCDRDEVSSDAQDNCDQCVRCLQGECAGTAQSLGTQGPSSVTPQESQPPAGALKWGQGEVEFIMGFLRTQLRLAAASPQSLVLVVLFPSGVTQNSLPAGEKEAASVV